MDTRGAILKEGIEESWMFTQIFRNELIERQFNIIIK